MSELNPSTLLLTLQSRAAEEFRVHRRLLTFGEYFDLFVKHPERYARSAAHYLRDCLDAFGVETCQEPWGTSRRFKLFDAPWDNGRGRVVGQERAQEDLYRALTAFVREGRIQRLLLLHGPNGSAKSSLLGCLLRALEAYSHTDEGALYAFNWIFPAEKISRGSIGFGEDARGVPQGPLDSFALLDDAHIDARIADDLRDNPILLIPRAERQRLLLDDLGLHKPGDAWDGQGFVVPDVILEGELSHMSRQIYEALLTAYNGDHARVLRHVQVERLFISRRYRRGAVTVEPQLRVDAALRQITADRSLQALPASLQNQALFEPSGDLVDANRGAIEFNDWLKRPPELNKYLLATSEKGTVALDGVIVYLDLVLLGSSNDLYLDAFKQSPDYPSFKARLELIRMPYLLNHHTEQQIYDDHLRRTDVRKPVLPHTTWAASLWAVLTRLTRPRAEHYPSALREIIAALTPLQKADLYASGAVPDGISPEQTRELRAAIPDLMEEGEGGSDYEGRYGASAREMKLVLLNAAERSDYPHLSPLAVLDELRRLVKDPSVHRFLQLEPDGPYRRPADFIEAVSERYIDRIDREVRAAMGLVDDDQYAALFKRYIAHVRHWLSGEKLYNETTGAAEPPDERFMQDVERRIAPHQAANDLRNDIITTVAAWSIEHPGQEVDLLAIFASRLDALKHSYFQERLDQLRRITQHLLLLLNDQASALAKQDRDQAQRTLDALQRRGYTQDGAREIVAFLLKNRYT